ncbi:MAG: SRPBCC domain-containing protein [Deltaproteobacteria bacterium]|nr:SRPBCC domain-containing protein [Deltaproteobacteria bacterium]
MLITQTLVVAAPAATVWRVLTDLDRYPEWNPFVVACRSTLEPGAPIAMRVRVLPFVAQPQRETIFEHAPGRRLRYGIPPLPLGALASDRSHVVEPVGDARSRYVSRFELCGWLAPVVAAFLGGRLERGFAAMSAAIKARAEALHADAARIHHPPDASLPPVGPSNLPTAIRRAPNGGRR